MAAALHDVLSPEKALIFRITHIDNLSWIAKNGLWAQPSGHVDPSFVQIGNPDLISARSSREVPLPPGGTLADYIPFYFTPRSPMLMNITTGFGGVPQRSNDEIVFLVSALHRLAEHEAQFVYTDRHAYLATARFSSDPAELASLVSYDLLRGGNFRRDPEAPERAERYQAEALVHHHVPFASVVGLACYTETSRARIESLISTEGHSTPTRIRRDWYF